MRFSVTQDSQRNLFEGAKEQAIRDGDAFKQMIALLRLYVSHANGWLEQRLQILLVNMATLFSSNINLKPLAAQEPLTVSAVLPYNQPEEIEKDHRANRIRTESVEHGASLPALNKRSSLVNSSQTGAQTCISGEFSSRRSHGVSRP